MMMITMSLILIVRETVLRTVVCGGSGVSRITVRSVWLLLLRVNGHKILHVHGFFALTIVLNAYGRQREQDGGTQGHGYADPGDDVAPFVFELGVALESGWPRLDEELALHLSAVHETLRETFPTAPHWRLP